MKPGRAVPSLERQDLMNPLILPVPRPRTSAPKGAQLLLIQTEVPGGPEPDWSKTLAIVMLTLFAARPRTADQYQGLLEACGFHPAFGRRRCVNLDH